MAIINPYRAPPGTIPDKLGRWLEELRRQLNSNTLVGEGNADTGNVGSAFVIFKEVDTPRASTIVSTADPELTAALLGSSLYGIEGEIKISSTDTQGFRFTLDGPLVASWEWATTDAGGVHNTGLGAKGVDQIFTETDSAQTIRFGGMMKTTVAATLAFSWAQETSDAGSTAVLEGSWMRITRLTQEGPVAAASIAEFIDNLVGMTHRWKCDEATGGSILADSGGGTTRDLTEVGALGYDVEGPDATSPAVSVLGSSVFAKNSVGGMDTASSGTVFFFVRNPGTGAVVISQNNTVNEVNQIQWARNPIGETDPNSRIGYTAIETSFVGDRRVITGGTNLDSHNTDDEWHLYGYTQAGAGGLPKMYVDGVEESGVHSVTAGGTPPPEDIWTDIGDANSRVVAFNGRFIGGSGNFTSRAAEICVLNGVIMTQAQFAELFSLVTN